MVNSQKQTIQPMVSKFTDTEWQDYRGTRAKDGKTLNNKGYYYAGQQDDDDFEKLIISKENIDLIDLSGHVWEDGVTGKDSKYDGKSNTTGVDKSLQGILVTLYTSDGKEVASTLTDKDGNYVFKKIVGSMNKEQLTSWVY